MLQGFAGIVELMVTLLVSVEKRYETKKSRGCKTKPQPRKRLRSPKIIPKDVDHLMDLGIGPAGVMIMELRCQPPKPTLEEPFGRVIKILTTSDITDPLSEGITQITIIIDTVTTIQDHNTSQTEINPGIGRATITIPDRLQCHDKIHPSQISADNPDQIHLTLRYLTDLEIETRAIIYLTTRNIRIPTTETSQTSFDSLQQTIQLMNYLDYAL